MATVDIAAVRAAFPSTPMGRLMDLIVLVATRCGLRESEIIALRWRDVQWEGGWIHVVQGYVRGETKLPKGKRGRSTPMPAIVKDRPPCVVPDHRFRPSRRPRLRPSGRRLRG